MRIPLDCKGLIGSNLQVAIAELQPALILDPIHRRRQSPWFSAHFTLEVSRCTFRSLGCRMITDANGALLQEVFHGREREQKSDVLHHGRANDLGTALKAIEGVLILHDKNPSTRPDHPRRFCFDHANSRTQQYGRRQMLHMIFSASRIDHLKKLPPTIRD